MSLASLFGRTLPSDESIPILDETYFTQSVTLLCVNEHNRTTRWSRRNGSLSDAIDVTDSAIQSTNAISRLTANISDPGFYTCEISKGGMPVTFLAGVFNFSELTGMNIFIFIVLLLLHYHFYLCSR